MRPSGAGQKTMSDLIFAALANPNGRYRGRTLLEYCYQKMDVREAFRSFSWRDRTPYVTLFEILLQDGADAGAFLRRNIEEFSYLQKVACEALKLIRTLLAGVRVQEKKGGRGQSVSFCRAEFERLWEIACSLLQLLEETGAMDPAEMPVPAKASALPTAEQLGFVGCNSVDALRLVPRNEEKTERVSWAVQVFFEDCMRGIHRLAQPDLPPLDILLREGADVVPLFEGYVACGFGPEDLLPITADALRLLTEILRGQGAQAALQNAAPLRANFFTLGTILREMYREALWG